MKKIISLFKRDYDGDRLVYDEIVSGAEWVARGEGIATVKYDGTCCMVRDGKLYKRYDRKLTKQAMRKKKSGHNGPWKTEDFKPAPDEWEAAEQEPNQHTGHWPGWVPVGDGPDDKWHAEAWSNCDVLVRDGTYELVGPKIQGNPYRLSKHILWRHGQAVYDPAPTSFSEIRDLLSKREVEGIVWHHPDGRMVKIKRRDFGLPWPVEKP